MSRGQRSGSGLHDPDTLRTPVRASKHRETGWNDPEGRGMSGATCLLSQSPAGTRHSPRGPHRRTRLAKKEEPVGQQYRARVSQTRACEFSRVCASTGGEGIGQAP